MGRGPVITEVSESKLQSYLTILQEVLACRIFTDCPPCVETLMQPLFGCTMVFCLGAPAYFPIKGVALESSSHSWSSCGTRLYNPNHGPLMWTPNLGPNTYQSYTIYRIWAHRRDTTKFKQGPEQRPIGQRTTLSTNVRGVDSVIYRPKQFPIPFS